MLGLVRSLAASLPTSHGIRVNGVCPSVTATPLLLVSAQHVLPIFEALKLPINSATELAEKIAGLNCDVSMNGKILYVEGGQAWDIEEGLERTKPEWMGTAVLNTLEKLEQYRKTMKP
jgi:NAD(P)-dependent dehydrogenase (short-subunit alcohol dehydrogenase family)